MQSSDIYKWIKIEENNYETKKIQIGDNWEWNMRDHIQIIFHLKNGIFFSGENDWLRPFKNIMQPILDLAKWTEDIEVKEVAFFIDGDEDKVESFLVKKYHDEVYVKNHNLDQLFDDITETDIDYGGVIVQKGVERPEVVVLNSISFCNQNDIDAGPVGFKTHYSSSELMQMSKYGWGNENNGATVSISGLIALADEGIQSVSVGNDNTTPNKSIEVYVVRGDMPNHYLNNDGDMEQSTRQIQIVGFYTNKEGNKEGVTLYKKKDFENILTFSSEPVFSRGLGMGGGERLLNPQIWTNFLNIHKTNMLEAGSKSPLYTDDGSYTTRNKIKDMENLEITTIEDGKRIYQVPTMAGGNIELMKQSVDEWLQHGQLQGAAFDPVLGKEAVSGTTFRGQERTVAQGRGSHDRRKGKRAKFIEQIYREWIIPDIVKEITKGTEFLATLSVSELTWVSDRLATNKTNQEIKKRMLKKDATLMTKEDSDAFSALVKSDFLKKGNEHILEVLKGELNDIETRIGINIGNKQKNLADLSDKVLSIFQFVFANPQQFQQAMQIPALANSFSDILEFSGMSIADFSGLINAQPLQVEGELGSTLQLQDKTNSSENRNS